VVTHTVVETRAAPTDARLKENRFARHKSHELQSPWRVPDSMAWRNRCTLSWETSKPHGPPPGKPIHDAAYRTTCDAICRISDQTDPREALAVWATGGDFVRLGGAFRRKT